MCYVGDMNSHNNSLLIPGTVLQKRYRIETLSGAGGWGAVYKASYISQELGRIFGPFCAIKDMTPSPVLPISPDRLKAMFEGEAQILVQLKHEHIPRITDYFQENNRYYLVMEYINGKTLEALMEDNGHRPFPEEQVLQWGMEICEVLIYLHTRKPRPWIFRDLKPANLMLDYHGKITVIDFGITRLFLPEDLNNLKVGTEGYAPPEQYRGQEDPRADIYALGITLHYLLSGRDPAKEKPFTCQDIPLRSLNPSISLEGELIISRALQNDVNKRFQSAREMLEAISGIFWKNLSSNREENFIWMETSRPLIKPSEPAFTRRLSQEDLKTDIPPEEFRAVSPGKEVIFASLKKDMFKDFTEGKMSDPDWFLLRIKAEKLSLTTGFNRLISLPSIPVVPFTHQKKAALDALRIMRGRVLLADEVGLGKTIEAGLIMKELLLRGLIKKILILVPASLTTQWKEEMLLHFREEFHIQEEQGDWQEYDRLIASIDTARREEHAEIITKIKYDLLIIDEAHKVKNRSTKAWKLINKITKRYILMLTATPVQNNLEELFNLITLLKPGQLKNLREFRKRFVDVSDKRMPVNPEELKKLIKNVMIRNRRSNVDIYLPPRKAGIYYLRESLPEKKFRLEVTQFIREYYRRKKDTKGVILSLMQLQKALGSSSAAAMDILKNWKEKTDPSQQEYEILSKLSSLGENVGVNRKSRALLEILKRTSDKVIIFTEFLLTQEYLRKLLEESGYKVALFNGQMSIKEKDEELLYFRKDAQVLISTQSGSEGKNLQFCHIMVNYDLPWNPMRLEQRIGRIHRLTQEREVLIFNFSLQDTFEEYILYLLSEKIRMFELVIGELDLILGDFEEDETFEEKLQKIWLSSSSDEDMKKEIERLGDKLLEARQKFQETMETDTNIWALFE